MQCAGGCSTPPPPLSHMLDQQSQRPIGCGIFCTRVMSPWLTITAHSVLLLSTEPLNGSLAFNKTAELAPNSALTLLSLAHFFTPVPVSVRVLDIVPNAVYIPC